MTSTREIIRVAIAMGSNLGDRFFNVELALRLLETPKEFLPGSDSLEGCSPETFISVVDTSFMYETSPLYMAEQPPFINCACLVETDIAPVLLLRLLKNIETAVGRVPSVRHGPRMVDLDILFYGDISIDTRPEAAVKETVSDLEGQLVVPHPAITEREFVLRPLNDMMPDYVHPVYMKPIRILLRDLAQKDESMCRVLPFPLYPQYFPNNPWPFPAVPAVSHTLTYWQYPVNIKSSRRKYPTRLMTILNATPDSFSDGGLHSTLSTALKYASEAVDYGTSIIDIGGYSTRPGAKFVDPQEEINRIVPLIQGIRQTGISKDEFRDRLCSIPISVDTFRPDVAEASIVAGANCINDVYAFTGHDTYPYTGCDANARAKRTMNAMKKVARDYGVPIVLMHSRGDAGEHKDYSMYMNGEYGSVVCGVQVELGNKIENIIVGKGGVRRWLVVVDPGIGFSKPLEGNLELLRDATKIVDDFRIDHGKIIRGNSLRGFPMLIGPSRKGFLGSILSNREHGRKIDPKERLWATAAAVACAIQQGAMIVRVHDTKEMADVATTADQLWGLK